MSRLHSDSLRTTALALGLVLVLPLSLVGTTAASPPRDGRDSIPDDPAGVILARQQGLGGPAPGALGPGFEAQSLLQGSNLTREELEEIDQQLLANILRIEDPVDRSSALIQAAIYKIQTRDLETARRALDRASESIDQITNPVQRDLRLISASKAFVDLAQEDITVATSGVSSILSLEPEMTRDERVETLERALDAFDRAAELSSQIAYLGYRPQTMYFAAEQQAQGGQSIGIVAFRNPSSLGDQQEEVLPELQRLAELYIDRAAGHARSIDMPVWRDVALSAVATSASISNQFELGRRVAGSIPGPELRFDALLSVAEGEARRGDPDKATADYAECARILASISIADLRGTLNDVLIESLIASGRFPDARRSVVLYSNDLDQLKALGAVAEAMGARGLSEEAREWILREVRPEHRSGLYRRVNNGVLRSLERFSRNDAYRDAGSF